MPRRIGILGSGPVGTTLANGFLRHGYEVIRGSRDPDKLNDWAAHAGSHASVTTFADAARLGELLVLAVKGAAAEAVVRSCHPADLFDKTIIDVTNPIAEDPPDHGVLRFFTPPNESLMERMQRMVERAHFVKAFSSIGSDLMVNPRFGVVRPTMFICGNDAGAKAEVGRILQQFGWEAEDLGPVQAARAIEPLSLLWCLRGWARGRWDHALKILRVDRRRPATAAAYSTHGVSAWLPSGLVPFE